MYLAYAQVRGLWRRDFKSHRHGECQAVWNRLAGLLIQTSMGSEGHFGGFVNRCGFVCQAVSRVVWRVCWMSIQVPSKTDFGVCQAMPL